MAQTVDTGTEKQTMKLWLKNATKAKPVGCAVGQGEDPTLALFVLDRHKEGLTVQKILKEKFPDAKNLRFGSAFPDEQNEKRVVVSLNKAVAGVGRKLVKTLKGTGFTKVMVQFDDGSPAEDAADEGEGAPPLPGQPPSATPQTAAPGASASGSAGAAAAPATAAPPQTAAPAQPAAPQMATPADNLPPPAAYVTAQQEWSNVATSFTNDLGKLQSAFSQAFRGHEMASDLEAAFQKRVDGVLAQFKPDLATVLGAMSMATDPAQRAAVAAQVQKTLLNYKSVVARDPTLIEIDSNPFVSVAVRKALGQKLLELSKSLAA